MGAKYNQLCYILAYIWHITVCGNYSSKLLTNSTIFQEIYVTHKIIIFDSLIVFSVFILFYSFSFHKSNFKHVTQHALNDPAIYLSKCKFD